MSKVDVLRKKYPRFIYENYSWKISGKDFKISFNFKIEPNIFFKPRVIIKNIDKKRINEIENRVLNPVRNPEFLNGVNNLVFHLGLIEILNYWKATCSPEIIIKVGPLNSEQIKWWRDLIMRGMGHFFYQNKIDFRGRKFVKIKTLPSKSKQLTKSAIAKISSQEKILLPVGGGKDSVVTLETLKKSKKNIKCFSLNPTLAAQKITKITGSKKTIIVRRKIDPKLLELNRQGFLNGHTPFSAYLAFLSVLCAAVFNCKYIAFSNERSSNEGNLKYLGRIINHQYSKSFDFEKKFREYSKKYLAPHQKLGGGLEYFSFLRPLYEIQIAKWFSKYSQYFSAFLSCNEAYKTNSGRKKPTKKWCGSCPKCLFIFAILYPFVNEEKLLKIFGKNLFENKNLLPIMQELVEERGFKPFECVGTKKESLIAFYLSWKKYRDRVSVKLPYLLKYFKNKILPKYPNLGKESKRILNSWNNQNFLPKHFEKILKRYSYKLQRD